MTVNARAEVQPFLTNYDCFIPREVGRSRPNPSLATPSMVNRPTEPIVVGGLLRQLYVDERPGTRCVPSGFFFFVNNLYGLPRQCEDNVRSAQ